MNGIVFILISIVSLYYGCFCVMITITAIQEEWCCRNRIPEWRDNIRVHLTLYRARYQQISQNDLDEVI
jgi:hypothetical protein